MDTSAHTMNLLFEQLGLPAEDEQIDLFIRNHKLFGSGIRLEDASFWTPSQSSFLQEAINCDSDWSEVVDELNTRLRA
ncbi:DUF2789 domain-containing protein [Nitrincola tapanii]|uniref:DUF2789 domain-containing protein n=1 Tax=Nitrincola tapanii TaxID=1708751 RepID=A0A5A9W043_9GAMM|nr:DUF2789 domain-containing protein [Nitrincola tapanii]KAA0874120.1 DUF2789 domain-containing protein [Nitrincola tapanii]